MSNSNSSPHPDALYTTNAQLRADVDKWKELTHRIAQGLTALSGPSTERVNKLRDELEDLRKSKDNAEKQNKKAEKDATLPKVDVDDIKRKIQKKATELLAEVNHDADILSPEDRDDLAKEKKHLKGDLVKDTSDAGESVNREAKNLQTVLSQTKVYFALLQQGYREANGDRKKFSFWSFRGDANFEENEDGEVIYLATSAGLKI